MEHNVYRHELKYLIPSFKVEELEKRIEKFTSVDKNSIEGGYQIRSLYFDNMINSAYYEKMDGVNYRKKWRIRIYNYDTKIIKLECKHKANIGIFKESSIISEIEYQKIMQGDIEFMKNKDILLQKFYIESINQRLHPKVWVDYERIPYVFYPGNVRITFDKNIRAGTGEWKLNDKEIPMINVFSKGEVVLEFKYTQFIPSFFQDILWGEAESQVAVSKYTLAYEKINEFLRGIK